MTLEYETIYRHLHRVGLEFKMDNTEYGNDSEAGVQPDKAANRNLIASKTGDSTDSLL